MTIKMKKLQLKEKRRAEDLHSIFKMKIITLRLNIHIT